MPEPHPEDTCEECGGPNVVWFAPNDLWNRVMRGGDRGAPDAVGIVCPVCFIRRAEALGVKPTGWSVQEEIIPPAPPVAVPGPASEPDRCACGAPLVSCHGCAESRCLWCDPYSEYERMNRCCAESDPPGPASVSPAEPPRRRITATHTRSLTFVQAEVDAVWNSGVLPIPHVEYVRADDPDARAIALFEALDGSSLELFWDEANDDVGYEITEDDPDA